MNNEDYFFPYEQVRDEQDKLISKVDQCIKNKKCLLVHAPTGIGKTISTLGPAIKVAIEKDLKILFLTSRHTQHLIALETIQLIKEKFELTFHVADIIGKRHMCLQPGASLLYSSEFFEFCKNMKEKGTCEFYTNARKTPSTLTPEGEKLLSDIEILPQQGSEKIIEYCNPEKMCPYEIAMEMAKKARVIICDYNYAFDPGVRMSLFSKAKIELDKCIIIVDEGHNLPERARNIYTIRLTNIMMKRAIQEAKKFGYDNALKILVGIQDILLSMSDNVNAGNEKLVTKGEFFTKVTKLKSFDVIVDDFEEIAETIRESQRQSYLGSIANFMKMWTQGEDVGFIRFISKRYLKNEMLITLSYRCLDPSLLTKEIFEETYSTILMSGTLTPTSMYKDLLGFPDSTEELVLSSPFPQKNKLSLVVPKTTTQYKQRSETMYKKIAEHCAKMVNAVPGNSAIFFPSYEMMRLVYNHLFELVEKTMFRESGDLTKKDREELLEKFVKYKNSGAVLLGVASGSFGEGIDFPGDLLKCVIVVGLPLQRPDLETKELISYYDAKFGQGWDYAYVNPAFSKTLQNSGRCIRSETDRGIVVFLDERFTWPNYFKNFPPDMELKISIDYVKLINEFFG